MTTTTEVRPWSGATQNANVRLEICTCAECGTVFGVEGNLHSKLRVNGNSFFCPNGHRLHYGKSRLQELEEELAYKQRQLQVTKGALTRMSNRIAFGVCPCCHRHFDNVQRHMATCHPDFLKKQDSAGEPADFESAKHTLAAPIEEMMSVPEAARYKGVTEQTVYFAIRSRRLPAVQIKSRFKVTRNAVEEWKVRGRKRT